MMLEHGYTFIRRGLAPGKTFIGHNSGFVLIAFAPSFLLGLATLFLWVGELSYSYPGPARGAGGLALMMLIAGIAVCVLHARKEAPTSPPLLAAPVIEGEAPSDEYTPSAFPLVEGLELLFGRWQQFQQETTDRAQKERNSAILEIHIRIAMSIAELEYKTKISFLKTFYGYKIERGTFLIRSGNAHPLVLKFDSMDNIKKEHQCYRTYIAPWIGSATPGQPLDLSQKPVQFDGQAWGAISYTMIGADTPEEVQTLGDYYKTHNFTHIKDALESVFTLLGPLWDTAQEPGSELFLYDEYKKWLSWKQQEIEEGLSEVIQSAKMKGLVNITLDGSSIKIGDLDLLNPVDWTKKSFNKHSLGSWVRHPKLRSNSIVHGDLHTGNILIEKTAKGAKPWVIDFPHTHVGPTVQDLARLEADVKFNLLPLESFNSTALHKFELGLLPPNSPTNRATRADLLLAHKTPEDLRDSEMVKAWEVIGMLREKIQGYMAGDNPQPYYLALLHATLPILYYVNRSTEQKIYALISAALLCERLS